MQETGHHGGWNIDWASRQPGTVQLNDAYVERMELLLMANNIFKVEDHVENVKAMNNATKEYKKGILHQRMAPRHFVCPKKANDITFTEIRGLYQSTATQKTRVLQAQHEKSKSGRNSR